MNDLGHSDWNTIALVVVAALNCYTAWIARRTEKNTNSMKDALVKKTEDEALARGTAVGLQQGRDEKN